MVIKKVTDASFKKYGKVIQGLACEDIIVAMASTPVPEDVVYEASVVELESCGSAKEIAYSLYGGCLLYTSPSPRDI